MKTAAKLLMGCVSILLAAVIGFSLSPLRKESLRRERTATVLQKIEEGLREYRNRNHSFPDNNAIDLGAAVLFQALTGDRDGDGLPDSQDVWSIGNGDGTNIDRWIKNW